jgi:hypothetical protein
MELEVTDQIDPFHEMEAKGSQIMVLLREILLPQVRGSIPTPAEQLPGGWYGHPQGCRPACSCRATPRRTRCTFRHLLEHRRELFLHFVDLLTRSA